jgi:hypothetical protein
MGNAGYVKTQVGEGIFNFYDFHISQCNPLEKILSL